MNKIILATKNKGKLAELKQPLLELGFNVETLPEDYADIPETGNTFEENALLKAMFVCDDLGLPALADDSGISVEGLRGAPGIYSARYGDDYVNGEAESNDAKNIRKLLDTTKGFSLDERACAFHCAMALVFPSGKNIFVHETWEGLLLDKLEGENGFGYDPLFFDEELKMSAAQMPKEIKMERSHRAKALRSLMTALEKFEE